MSEERGIVLKKTGLLLGGIAILASLAAYGFWELLIRDEPAPNDSDLVLAFQSAPKEDNGYLRIGAAGVEVAKDQRSIEALLKTEPLDPGKSREMLDTHREALQVFFNAAETGNFGPAVLEDTSAIQGGFALLRLAELQAKTELADGRPDLAADAGTNLVELGFRYEHAPGSLLNVYFGMTVKSHGLDIVHQALAQGINDSHKRQIRERLLKCADSRQGLEQALRLEYSGWRDFFDDPSSFMSKNPGKPSSPPRNPGVNIHRGGLWALVYKPHRTRRLYADYFRGLIAAVKGTGVNPSPPTSEWGAALTGNYLGAQLLSLITPKMTMDGPDRIERKLRRTVRELSGGPRRTAP